MCNSAFATTWSKCRLIVGVRPEPPNCLFASPKWNADTMSEKGGVHHLLIRGHKKKVDLVHCTCWAVVRKRWRNTSSLSMRPCPSVHQTHAYLLTCIDASALLPSLCSPGSYMYVHIRSYLHVCLRQEGLQPAAEPPCWKSSCCLNT
jgi:hypothetical protein